MVGAPRHKGRLAYANLHGFSHWTLDFNGFLWVFVFFYMFFLPVRPWTMGPVVDFDSLLTFPYDFHRFSLACSSRALLSAADESGTSHPSQRDHSGAGAASSPRTMRRAWRMARWSQWMRVISAGICRRWYVSLWYCIMISARYVVVNMYLAQWDCLEGATGLEKHSLMETCCHQATSSPYKQIPLYHKIRLIIW